ncbi:addiction module antidote protein, HigA family [Methylobacterium phyllostachyos]|uniref:Addiction module antidote protein, HigA family n=1 Tax=Methylobacterium phyllostachyos TaxID=582672 RepID=A0A1H0FUC8_9HYPH|nr:HigA family addiction module antitoxin [Methylobacterium phyllostachyos]SDN98171.1 addiction module antidote protein, HigA family [Methylobacterium phyllostachyos]
MVYRLANPGHPGGYVRRNIIEARDLTVMDAASLLDVPRQALFEFLNGKTGLTPELALRIEAVFGVEMETLMEMQTHFDIAEARKRYRDVWSELVVKAKLARVASKPNDPGAVPQRIMRRGHAFG